MFDVITIGSATRDAFLRSKEFKTKRDPSSPTDSDLVLPLGSKIKIDEIFFESGGGATNAAVTFGRQKLRVACICRVGPDPGGKAVVEDLEKEGVNTELVIRNEEFYTGYSIILVTASGERTILVFRGASSYFTDEMIPKRKLDTKWIFISSLAGNTDLLKGIIGWANKHNIKTALIPGGDELKKGPKVLAPIFAKSDVVIMNREEASRLTGIDYGKKEQIARKICLLTRSVGVITDGPYGATACDREYYYHVPTHGNKAISRTGAGDAFASGFVAGLIKYENVEGALELAADNGSSVINYFSAKKGILSDGERPFKDRLKITKVRI